ncbi:uncharacterized protein LOC111347979 isoform X2 [Spodoptera litura]|uniref:Uncharacterized protein LOC111347979 isoform X2 n=1 Tax=Spodoptera litura TaxID=69820 RepID=A0A9J7DLP7_SPOLT|nr:uncharacterized protein LOC111347979 isoform X2 [Spodoptera litura]
METCVRGFSFMAENKVDMVDLQFIEGGELERAWRSNRRERMKQREQKIWDKFVEEQDVVKGVCTDDPYQFLDQLPESCLKEIMDNERQRMPKAKSVEEIKVKEIPQPSTGNHPSGDDGQHTCVVTFADDIEKDECDMFHIFDDDQSEQLSSPALEEEVLNEPMSPETVRDNQVEHCPQPTERHITLEKTSSKSSENVTHMIESSIYCAKVKDLRMKINEELISLMTTLDRRDILTSEPDDIMRMVKRSAEFCGRFNRIYMYQLQRQVHDIKRNNSVSLPFAKHTQFQSQMVRIVSLHQNMLQSFQVFHKSVSQTCCVRESASALGSLIACVRDSTHMCLNVPPPKDFTAALDLYKDDLIMTCDKVDEFVGEYAIRCEEFLNSFVNVNTNTRKAPKKQMKKRSFGNWNKSSAKNDTEARLSMYSLDTLRLNLHPKSTSSKDNQASTVKNRVAKEPAPPCKRGQTQSGKPAETAKGPKKSRRPLMRDPHAGRPKAPKPIRENDIRTMVEAVETCASSHISREASPRPLGTVPGCLRRKAGTPRRPMHTPCTLTPLGPLTPLRTYSPLRSPSPLRSHSPLIAASPLRPSSPFGPLMPLTPRTLHAPLALQVRHTPRVNHAGPPYHTPRNTHDPHKPKVQPSPRIKKRQEEKPKRPLNFTTTVKEAASGTRTDLESEDMMTPVCKIQCAMKKNLELEETKQSAREQSIKKSPSVHPVDPNEKKKFQPVQGFPDTPRLVPGLKLHGSPKRDGEDLAKYGECSKTDKEASPAPQREPSSDKKDRSKMSTMVPDQCEVTRLLKQLCSGDASRTERVTGAKNAQLVFVNGNNPRQPSTPQLLKILEETIQKKIPKPLFGAPSSASGLDRYRLVFNISEKTADSLFQYRTKFVQHMLTSNMYANSAIGQPWEMIGSVSEQIIDELLLNITKEMQLYDLVQELYNKETC